MVDVDDKDLGMICLTAIAVLTLLIRPEIADKVIIAIVSAIAGFVTGRKTGGG